MNRVVTGFDSAGQPIVLQQGEPPTVIHAGRYVTTELWVTDRTPPVAASSDASTGNWDLEPPVGGTCFRIVEIAPADAAPESGAVAATAPGSTRCAPRRPRASTGRRCGSRAARAARRAGARGSSCPIRHSRSPRSAPSLERTSRTGRERVRSEGPTATSPGSIRVGAVRTVSIATPGRQPGRSSGRFLASFPFSSPVDWPTSIM